MDRSKIHYLSEIGVEVRRPIRHLPKFEIFSEPEKKYTRVMVWMRLWRIPLFLGACLLILVAIAALSAGVLWVLGKTSQGPLLGILAGVLIFKFFLLGWVFAMGAFDTIKPFEWFHYEQT